METLIILLIIFGVVILVLAVLNAFLISYFYKTNKKFDLLLEKGKIKDLKEVLFKQIDKAKNQEEIINKIIDRIKSLESVSEKTFQKIGVIRFNPFDSLGGNQSFVIALLDKQNNGFVISSLFIKDGNRVYAKAIQNGNSEYSLSNEEKEALKRAMAI
ncbi:MAG: DUF4446 family protein [Patescibacteria group bacterium]